MVFSAVALRRIGHIAWRGLAAAAALALIGVLVVVGLTRTQVGRDAVSTQIERQFNARFQGRLHIGSLQGNLLQTLSAHDVRLYDAQGRTVAEVDSVEARPHWRSLLQRNVQIGALTLYQPTFHLVREAGGSWNLTEALRSSSTPSSPADTSASPWQLSTLDLRLVNGRVETSNQGTLPRLVAQDRIFNYANATLRNLDAVLQIDGSASPRRFAVQSLSARLERPNFRLESLQASGTFDDGRLHLDQLNLRTGRSRLTLDGSARSSEDDRQLQLALQGRPVNFDEWRRLVPALPLADTATVGAQVQGPLDDLHVERVSLAHGQSVVQGSGHVRGLPNEVRFDFSFKDNAVVAQDLRALFPDRDWSQLAAAGRVQATIQAQGSVQRRAGEGWHAQVQSEGTVRTPSGQASGTGRLTYRPDDPLAYEADVDVEQLDLARLLQDPAWAGAVNGNLRITQAARTDTTASGPTLRLTLENTRLARLGQGALQVNAQVRGDQLRGTARLDQESGFLQGRFHVDRSAPHSTYDATVRASQANLAPLLKTDSLATRLNGQLRVAGQRLADVATAQGTATLQMDSSHVQYGSVSRLIAPFTQDVALSDPDDQMARVRFRGDMLEGRLEGDVEAPSLPDLFRRWGTALHAAALHAYHKPYRGPASPDTSRSTLRASSLLSPEDPLHLRTQLQVKQTELVNALLPPSWPSLPPGLRTQLQTTIGADTLHLNMEASADVLPQSGIEFTRPHLRLQAASSTPDGALPTVDATLTADTLWLGHRPVQRPELTLHHAKQTSTIRLASNGPVSDGPLEVAAQLELLPTHNRLTLSTLQLALPGYAWTHERSDPIDLYADAVVVPELVLANTAQGKKQHLALKGVLSDAPRDTLMLQVHRLSLQELSHLTGIQPALGGTAEGQLAFTGGLQRPELTGGLDVRRLSFDDRLLGHLSIESRYRQAAPGIALDARLRPLANPDSAERPVERSRVRLSGTVHPSQPGAPQDQLDLRFEAQRADLFFLEYIFNHDITNVEGAARGRGRITGSFRHPLFQADLRVADGQFRVPRFNLRFQGQGRAQVDREGIHLRDFSMSGPTGGEARVGGSLLFNEYRYLSFDLHGELNQLRVMNVEQSRDLPFYGTIWGSGDFRLTGPLSHAQLRSSNVVAAAKSDVYIPVKPDETPSDAGFIVFADSTGQLPNLQELTQRQNILADRPAGERKFAEGLDLDLNITVRSGTTVHLVIDPLLGDEINAVGSGRIQLQRTGGELFTYGTVNVSGGDYLFTAGELFFRRFLIQEGGTLTWSGEPGNPRLDLTASYRTRASTAGLPETAVPNLPSYLPVSVQVNVAGRVASPRVNLDLAIDREAHARTAGYEGLESYLNQGDLTAEYATSVLLTNSFLLTTSLASQEGVQNLSTTRNQLAFNSVSQLVASQLNRYLSKVVPNFDLTLGLQGQSTENLGVTYGLALRLLNERLIIRGEGAYQNERTRRSAPGLEGEFVVEMRLSPRVSVEAFYRREGDLLNTELTNTSGAGLSYETEFSTWHALVERLFGWMWPDNDEEEEKDDADDSPPPAVSAAPSSEE